MHTYLLSTPALLGEGFESAIACWTTQGTGGPGRQFQVHLAAEARDPRPKVGAPVVLSMIRVLLSELGNQGDNFDLQRVLGAGVGDG